MDDLKRIELAELAAGVREITEGEKPAKESTGYQSQTPADEHKPRRTRKKAE